MRIATWNVNSIAARLPHVTAWLAAQQPDVLCLQEIKCVEARFPLAAFTELGYHALAYGQPSYNGVATLTRAPAQEVTRGFPGDPPDAAARMLVADVGGVRVVNVYVPNGAPLYSERFHGKLAWLSRLHAYLAGVTSTDQPLALCGDYNVAPEERDVFDPVALAGEVLFTPEERAALAPLRAWGLVDSFRLHHEEGDLYSWWDYRQGSFRRNRGLRIDHIWVTPPLAAACTAAWIDVEPRKQERPSDHTPVVAEFAIG
jgi:exodeoxyribonuclease-3